MTNRGRRLIIWIAERSLGWLAVGLFIIAWQIVAVITKTHFMATFASAAVSFWQIVTGPDLARDVLPSVERTLIGFAIAAALGILLGLIIGTFQSLDPWVRPTIEFMRALPPPLIIPVAMLLVGVSSKLIVFVIIFGSFWPVLINTVDGARRVEPLYLETARSLQVPKKAVLHSVVMPASLAMIMAGLRIALSTALIMMVLAEMLSSSTGIGYLVLFSQQTFNVPATYGGVLVLGGLGLLFEAIFLIVERRVLRWSAEFRGGTRV